MSSFEKLLDQIMFLYLFFGLIIFNVLVFGTLSEQLTTMIKCIYVVDVFLKASLLFWPLFLVVSIIGRRLSEKNGGEHER